MGYLPDLQILFLLQDSFPTVNHFNQPIKWFSYRSYFSCCIPLFQPWLYYDPDTLMHRKSYHWHLDFSRKWNCFPEELLLLRLNYSLEFRRIQTTNIILIPNCFENQHATPLQIACRQQSLIFSLRISMCY